MNLIIRKDIFSGLRKNPTGYFAIETKGVKLFDYNSLSKLGDRKAIEIKYEKKDGNRKYISRVLATTYGENNFLNLFFKSRDKYSDQMLPLANTMLDSFRFTKNNTLAPVDSGNGK